MLGQVVDALINLPPLVYMVTCLATVWYFTRIRVPINIPPLPANVYPLLGHIPHLRAGLTETLQEWAQMKGDIFSLYIGSHLFVVMSSLDVIKEAFVKKADAFSDRPPHLLMEDEKKTGEGHGIISNSGSSWKEQRTVSLAILREFGMGKNWLAERINEEVVFYLNELAKVRGEPQETVILTNISVSNVICAILIGQRFEYDDPYFVTLIKLLNEQIKLLSVISPANFFPFLKYLPGDLFNKKKTDKNRKQVVEHFCAKFVKEKDVGEEQVNPDCFINAYYNEMWKKQKADHSTTLNKDNLIRVIFNLFSAGTETTSTTIQWILLFALHHPEWKEKINKEIEEQIGFDRTPSMQDKIRMPYTNAFILECQRIGCIAHLALPHYCSETVEVAGYTIPKGTVVIPFLSQVLNNSKTWEDTQVFRPERFLDKDNKIEIPETFIPFGIGRRVCLAEALAKMELFLFTTGIFQRFHILPEDPDNLPSLDPVIRVTQAPQKYKLRFIAKTQKSH